MGAFTNIAANADLQSLGSGGGAKALNELLTAYDEHRKVLGQSAGPAQIVAGDDIQLASIFYDMQDWIETYCTSFTDPDIDPEAKDSRDGQGDSYANYANFAALMTKLGWSGDGWRKSNVFAAGAFTMGTGKCAAGDYIQCTWLYEDLQNAFRELTRTYIKAQTYDDTTDFGRIGSGFSETSWEDVLAMLDAAWADTGWGTPWGYYRCEAEARHYVGDLYADSIRSKIAFKVTGINTTKPHIAKMYCSFYTGIPGWTWWDPDGVAGGVSEYKLHLIKTFTENSNATETSDVMGAVDTAPVYMPGAGDPGEGNAYLKTTSSYYQFWTLDWTFTYT